MQPTHRVVHHDGWTADIYIADSHIDKLSSENQSVRTRARHAVCIAFRKTCLMKHPDFHLAYVEFAHLNINALTASR